MIHVNGTFFFLCEKHGPHRKPPVCSKRPALARGLYKTRVDSCRAWPVG